MKTGTASGSLATVLASAPSWFLVELMLSWQTFFLFAAYGVAVYDGHVPPPPHIPDISDFGCYYPEANLFQAGFIITAAFMAMGSMLFQAVVNARLLKLRQRTCLFEVEGGGKGAYAHIDNDAHALIDSLTHTNNGLVYMSLVSSGGLIGLSTVNECEDGNLHRAFALTFFFVYLGYEILVCRMLRQENSLQPSSHRSSTLPTKEIITIVTLVSIITFVTSMSHSSETWHQVGAAAEWIAVLSIMAFNAAFIPQLKGLIYVSILNVDDDDSGENADDDDDAQHCATPLASSSASPQSMPTTTVLSKVAGSFAIVTLVVWQTTFLLACYVVAVLDGDVKPLPYIPMISDCGCYYPEANLFQAGFIVSAAIMAMSSLMFQAVVSMTVTKLRSVALMSSSISADPTSVRDGEVLHLNSIDRMNNNLIWLSLVACVGLAGLSTVNTCEVPPLHAIFAVTFFVAYLIYEVSVCRMLGKDMRLVSSGSLRAKQIITGVTSVALLLFVVGQTQHGTAWHQVQAASEWCAVFSILAFNIAFLPSV
eukprot:TRINITY_DN7163_c0_g1_i1.p1 TRINITY_DN7163_c0_g1~~TRINITY_DN7163_c0_g1_i1.p1  ORF type:complete len:579 (-),score=105.50 TRINITY_DN7163_c0_g1_i1:148-1758(-)